MMQIRNMREILEEYTDDKSNNEDSRSNKDK